MRARQLFRSGSDRMVGGVVGGLAEYFHVDSSLLRLGWVLATVFAGFIPGILAYLVAVLIIPERPEPGKIQENDQVE